MRIRSISSAVLSAILFFQALPSVAAFPGQIAETELHFSSPVSAVSVAIPLGSDSVDLRFDAGAGWSKPYVLELNDDGDPGSRESDLFTFPFHAIAIRVTGILDAKNIHAITVSQAPVKVRTASRTSVTDPAILTRAEWGADSAYLYNGSTETPDTSGGDASKGDNGTAVQGQSDSRVKDCLNAQRDYQSEFATEKTVKTDASGRAYRWPLQYSKEIKLIAVHHTALLVRGDSRDAVERVRSVYKYHAVTRGWGDIGYHYIIDEQGQIYEGRQGGERVVGGHAYCNNIGTLGIVLMGNFEIEQPSQVQAQSLQWLLKHLADQYHIDINRSVQFHGKIFASPFVRHRDLVSTLCPGYYAAEAFSQIVANVRAGKLDGFVNFPVITSASSSKTVSLPSSAGLAEGLSFTGRPSITINPGGMQRLSFAYTSGPEGAYEGKRVAVISLSTPDILLWQDDGYARIPVTKGILLQSDLPAGETSSIQLIVQAPINEGMYSMDIGGQHFEVAVSGRRARTGEYVNPFAGDQSKLVPVKSPVRKTQLTTRIRPASRRNTAAASSVSSSSVSVRPSSVSSSEAHAQDGSIRIRLTATPSPVVTFVGEGSIDGAPVSRGTHLALQVKNNQCLVLAGSNTLAQADIVRMMPTGADTLTIDAVRGAIRSYQGVIECRVVDGILTLINEVPLDRYMAGLAEEPDSEPYEKQRAFAVAARTYAAYYAQPSQRKFPGKPYDGSDDPAIFQSYTGTDFSGANPQWLRAVTSTAGQVLMSGDTLIRPPYFSSDDGHTRSPSEAGWNNFPFAAIFASKADPWCAGQPLKGHGVGMSGCGAAGQAKEGRSAEQILQYYYPGARIGQIR